MEPKTVISFVVILALIYFRFGPGSRLLKKKSHHYIVPPSPDSDRNWIPVDIGRYKKTIYIKKNSPEDILKTIAEISPGEKWEADYSYDGWIRITVEDVSFGEYHALLSICDAVNEGQTYGFCEHRDSPEKDYIVRVDEESYENLIGVFRTNKNFGIYLPNSESNAKGNISGSPVKEIDFFSELKKLPV
ncbi:hypothetical protein GCM10009118_04950 [Wandonia haliotis]|uniref:Uncharacterized protein n=1 Tax=Wandonia haliotis TaxID=574963 RepID=A0ABN1MLJ6_9FLAO